MSKLMGGLFYLTIRIAEISSLWRRVISILAIAVIAWSCMGAIGGNSRRRSG